MEVVMQSIRVIVNGVELLWEVDDGTTLVRALRLSGLTGTKIGCDLGTCGSCTVLVDGEPIVSCLELAARVDGRRVETIEGTNADPHGLALQDAFGRLGAAQ